MINMLFESFRLFVDSTLLYPIAGLVLCFGSFRLAYYLMIGGMNHD